MKILIVEDEIAAYDNLVGILARLDPLIEVVGSTESIGQTVRWLQRNPAPDLIFMDINLSDGSAFAIFKQVKVEVPIIFTTAYDEYAIEAFKVNSIDYLLKPVNPEELQAALNKFRKWQERDITQYLSRLSSISVERGGYRDKLMVQYRDRLLPIAVRDIAYFYYTEHKNMLGLMNGMTYVYKSTLEHIITTLNPTDFIRANRQFIVNRDSIKDITPWFDGRLMLNLCVETPERIYISKNKASEFKQWMERGGSA